MQSGGEKNGTQLAALNSVLASSDLCALRLSQKYRDGWSASFVAGATTSFTTFAATAVSTHAFSWKKCRTEGWYAARSTSEMRIPFPEKTSTGGMFCGPSMR